MNNLSGKVAIVTGSSKGIGAGIAERLAAQGASVVVNYSRSAEDAASVVDGIVAKGGQAFAVKANLARPADIPPLIEAALAKSPYPMVHVYCSTKGAVDTLTRSLAMELGPRGIRVVGIAPGFTATEGNAESARQMTDMLVSKTPLGRVGMPADIAAAVAFAVSSDAGWVTGTTIDVAGGMVF